MLTREVVRPRSYRLELAAVVVAVFALSCTVSTAVTSVGEWIVGLLR